MTACRAAAACVAGAAHGAEPPFAEFLETLSADVVAGNGRARRILGLA